MAFPSDIVRTKNWGNEVLTDSDLEGQFDLIINWVMASLNSSTGHTHSGSGNNGPKLSIASALTISSQATGDMIYASSASAWARLAKGTALQKLRMNAGATAPEWADDLAAATQAEQETGSSTTVYVTPGRQHFHQSAVKGWIKFDGSSGSIGTGDASYNVSSVTDNGTGDYTINWATDISSGNYCLFGMGKETGATYGCGITIKNGTTPTGAAVNILTQKTYDGNVQDSTYVCVGVLGDLA